MKHAEWCPYRLDFTFNAVTSRQSMTYKDTYFIRVTDDARPNEITYAECALFKGLSAEDCADYEKQLSKACPFRFRAGAVSLARIFVERREKRNTYKRARVDGR